MIVVGRRGSVDHVWTRRVLIFCGETRIQGDHTIAYIYQEEQDFEATDGIRGYTRLSFDMFGVFSYTNYMHHGTGG